MKHVRGCPLFTHPTQRKPDHPTDCRCPGPTPGTQTARLVTFLRTHPGASGLEIIHALNLPKYTSRISDARAAGINVVCIGRADGRKGYVVVETVLTFAPAEQWPADLKWDGLFRCEDHEAGFHPTIDEASACIRGERSHVAPLTGTQTEAFG